MSRLKQIILIATEKLFTMHSNEKSKLFTEITVDESATVCGGTTQVIASVAGTTTTTIVATNSGSSSGTTTSSTTPVTPVTPATPAPPVPPAPPLILPIFAVVSSGLIKV